MRTTLILGNITFESSKAIVHEITGILICDDNKEAEEIGEYLCNTHIAYIIPSIYPKFIEYEPNCNNQIIEFFKYL